MKSVGIRREGPFLQVEAGMICDSSGATRFDIPFPGLGYFRGEITRLAPPLIMQEGILFQFDVVPDVVMRSRTGEEHAGIMASYLRWSASGEL